MTMALVATATRDMCDTFVFTCIMNIRPHNNEPVLPWLTLNETSFSRNRMLRGIIGFIWSRSYSIQFMLY